MDNHRHQVFASQRGFTLIEILMAVVIIGILSAVALRSVQTAIEGSRVRETQVEIDDIMHAIAGNPALFNNGMRSDFGYVGDVGAVPSNMGNLVTNPGGYSTWNGPYIRRRFSQDADGFKKDAWGNTYSFSNGITLASTGGGATPMTKSASTAAADLTSNPINGTVHDAAGNPPGDSSVAITLTVTYPNGSGGTTSASVNPNAGGSFSFSGIPVGVRSVRAVYRATNDTDYAYAAVLPKTGAVVQMRLPGAPFAGGGGGGGSATIEYVSGSASSPSNDVRFSVVNSGTAPVTITWITVTWASPTSYFRYIKWAGTTVFDENNPHAASGDQCNFTVSQTLASGSTVEIRLEAFKANPTGGSNVDMSNVDFIVTFSNGQSVSFNSA